MVVLAVFAFLSVFTPPSLPSQLRDHLVHRARNFTFITAHPKRPDSKDRAFEQDISVSNMLWAAGSSSDCQLGLPTLEDQHQFAPVPAAIPMLSHAGNEISKMAAGSLHTLFLVTPRRVEAEQQAPGDETQYPGASLVVGCGDNARGQLGAFLPRHVHQLTEVKLSPTAASAAGAAPALNDGAAWQATSLHASWQTSFVLQRPISRTTCRSSSLQSDRILSFGSNDLGELGSKSTSSQDAQPNVVALEGAWSCLSSSTETFNVAQMSAGPRHVLAILQSRPSSTSSTQRQALIGWGAARKGELGESHRSSLESYA